MGCRQLAAPTGLLPPRRRHTPARPPALPPSPHRTDAEGDDGGGGARGRSPERQASTSLQHITVSRFMPTSRRIVQFSSGKSAPAGARIVYIDGAFDLFHVGHVEILKVRCGAAWRCCSAWGTAQRKSLGCVGGGVGGVPLLGGHGEHSSTMGGLEHRSPLLFDIVRGIVEQWPQPPDPIQGRSLADVIATNKIIVQRRRSNRGVMRRLIEKVAAQGSEGEVRRRTIDSVPAQSPLPNFDRRAMVQGYLGFHPLLYQAQVPWARRKPAADRVHVYLDVSGSMEMVKGALYGAILDCHSQVHPTVHLFSTAVEDVTIPELRRGVCKSTGGTDIACVASHIAKNGIGRALVVTDGWVGRPAGEHLAILSRTKLAVALFGASTQKGDLEPVADHLVELECGDPT